MPKVITAKIAPATPEATPPCAEVTYDFGDNLDAAVAKFGAEVVYNGFVADATIGVQAIIRRELKAGNTDQASIQAKVSAHVPGTAAPRTQVDALTVLKRQLGGMSREDAMKLLGELKASVK